jgi:hypothetical protein
MRQVTLPFDRTAWKIPREFQFGIGSDSGHF